MDEGRPLQARTPQWADGLPTIGEYTQTPTLPTIIPVSVNPTPITPAIHDYLLGNFSAEDQVLADLRQEAVAAGLPDISICADQARFLQFFLKSIQARFVLELGTLGGYSALVMARALPPEGKLWTVESSARHADFARRTLEKVGLKTPIEIIHSPALDFLRTFQPDQPLDFVFIDADKANYSNYLDLVTPLLRPGGVVCADNALAFGNIATPVGAEAVTESQSVESIRAFNQYLKGHPAYSSCLVTMGDGMAMGLKL